MSNAAALAAQGDAAAASGDLSRAEALLREAAAIGPADTELLLKLAGVQRALRNPQQALSTVHRALASDPRDFMALLMRASLLDALDEAEAAEAWSHALAQKPDGPLPPALATVIAKAEARVEQWTAQREATMANAMRDAESRADGDQRSRLARFRSNALKQTKVFHSEPTQFHYPELPEREFHARSLFPWLEQLEAATDEIAEELQIVMSAERAELEPYIEYPDHLPLDQWRELNRNRDWTAIHLLRNGERVEANARHCPRTLTLLERCDQPRIGGSSPNAMFSLLAPNTRIPPHVGVNNARLVCHLPLIVPEGCWFRVGAQTRFWERGAAFVFDDTIEHEAMNPSDELRIVLIFDVWHPDLSEVEREGVAALVALDNLGDGPGL